MDCLFESRSSTGGGVFWAPLPPCPLPPRGSGFPQGSELPAQGAPYSLFRPGASIPPYFPHCFHGTGGQGQAFRCPGFRSAFVLSGGFPVVGFQTSWLPPCFQGAMLSGGFQEAMLSGGFQEARLPPGVRGPGLSGCFQEVFRGFQEALK